MKTKCPYCKYIANRHLTLKDEDNPREDDVSICIDCGEVSVYKKKGNSLSLVKVNLDDIDKNARKEINDISIAWAKTKAIRNVQEK